MGNVVNVGKMISDYDRKIAVPTEEAKDYPDPLREARRDIAILNEAATPQERRDLENQITGE